MTDAELVAAKLAFIETTVAELRRLALPERLRDDVKEERFVLHSLQLAIQAAIDVASHIVSSDRLGEPSTNRELFELLQRHGWLAADEARTLHDMAGFRNVVVHGYQAVDLGFVERILAEHLPDLLGFCSSIGGRLAGGAAPSSPGDRS